MDRFDVLQDMNDQALAALENSAPLSDLVAALRAPGRPAELSGQAAAVAAFSAQQGKAQHQEKTVAMEKLSNVRWLPSRVGTKLGAATAVAMLAFTGVAAAAVTGSLPAPIQSFVHAHLGAVTSGRPSVKTSTAPKSHAGSATHTGPTAPPSGATSPAGGQAGAGASAGGQCEAFAQHDSWRGSLPQPPAATSLQRAAAAAGKTVSEFCAPYLVHGKPSSPTRSDGGPGNNGGSGSNGGRGNGGSNGGNNGPHGSGSTSSSTTTGHGHGHGDQSGVSSHSGNGEH
jgi:hypothetical protein